MANRYFVMGQVFIANGTTTVTEVGRQATAGNTTINVTGGAGNFTIYRAQGVVATMTSGSAAVTGSVVTLSAGANTITVGGNGTCTLNLTIATAANWNSVESWSAASGGTGGASVPTSSDNAYFNANSFTGASQVVTVDATAYCLDMDWTGATNTPAVSFVEIIFYYRNCTLIANMSFSAEGSGGILYGGAGGGILTSNGLSIGCRVGTASASANTLTLGDNLIVTATGTTSVQIASDVGTFATNNNSITTDGGVQIANRGTVTLGSSAINCTSWSMASTSTLTANTATINCSGNFAGGGITTYNIVNLTGATSTISGSNTFTNLILPAATAQTITLTAGSIQTIGTATLDGDATHAHTIVSGTSGTLASLIATDVTETYVTYTDIRRSWSTLKVGEVIVYNRKLSFVETENIRLATKWRHR